MSNSVPPSAAHMRLSRDFARSLTAPKLGIACAALCAPSIPTTLVAGFTADLEIEATDFVLTESVPVFFAGNASNSMVAGSARDMVARLLGGSERGGDGFFPGVEMALGGRTPSLLSRCNKLLVADLNSSSSEYFSDSA